MIKEDKELLLKDLSARLPYGVIIHLGEPDEDEELYCLNILQEGLYTRNLEYNNATTLCPIEDSKPYLRPMSSMTSKECMQLTTLLPRYFTVFPEKLFCTEHINGGIINFEVLDTIIDFYNSHHLDWRGLIPKGLALEATKDMYKI